MTEETPEERARKHARDLNQAYADKFNDAAITTGNIALKTAMLINGGAAVALLALIGSLAANIDMTGDVERVANSLLWFGVGVFLAALGLAATYLASYFGVGDSHARVEIPEPPYIASTLESESQAAASDLFRHLAIGVGGSSLLAFVVGIFVTRSAVIGLFQ
ncbi:MAG: hypothetical protein AB7O56_03520 [Bauldia sp.]